jgi:hypothetical protein
MLLQDGLILVGRVGCNKIEVNLDCMDVINVMKSGGDSIGLVAAIGECSLLSHNFVEVQFFHCLRKANMASLVLTSHAKGPMSTVWHE